MLKENFNLPNVILIKLKNTIEYIKIKIPKF